MKFLIANLISPFPLAIVLAIFLNSIIGQMDTSIQLGEHILVAGGPDIPFLVPVSFYYSVYARNHYVVSYVEFTVFVEERSMEVLLHNICLVFAVVVTLLSTNQHLNI